MRHLILDNIELDNINCISLGLEENNFHVILIYEDKNKLRVDFDSEDDLISFVKSARKRECSA